MEGSAGLVVAIKYYVNRYAMQCNQNHKRTSKASLRKCIVKDAPFRQTNPLGYVEFFAASKFHEGKR